MRFIKLAIISFVFFFLLITGISLFIPSTVRISRAIEINASPAVVMNQVGEPVNWKNWFPVEDSVRFLYVNGEIKGILLDSLQGLLITGRTDTTVTASQSGPRAGNMSTGWFIVPGSGPANTTVQWWMAFKLRWYPWEKFSSLIFEKKYGSRMELGLSRLKRIAENN